MLLREVISADSFLMYRYRQVGFAEVGPTAIRRVAAHCRWTASVTYVFRENVKKEELAVNPLGLTIVRFRANQAFS